MKTSPIALAIILVLLPSVAQASIRNDIQASSTGGNASVRVQVNNQVNTDNTTTTTTTGNTNVEIRQTGEGSSSVSVNGKEWKLEGPGEISVEEVLGETDSRVATPTPTTQQTEEQKEQQKEIMNILERFKQVLQNFFTSLFG